MPDLPAASANANANAENTSAVLSASIGRSMAVSSNIGSHSIAADEPAPFGADSAPGPFDLLLASLASCVLMTIRMYADRKEWPLESARVHLTPHRAPAKPLERIDLRLELQGDLDDEQLARLRQIADRCPVHKTLRAGVEITHAG